jgi:hypothetical protein
MKVAEFEINVTGKHLKIASVAEEWEKDITNPEQLVSEIKKNKIGADIFTFWQRPPHTEPKYHYHMELDDIAALQITSFKEWWEKKLDSKNRNVARKAEKKGVKIEITNFDDELVKGIVNIYNETPVRQNKPFWHYGKDFETVKRENSTYLENSEFICAYYDNELIGFIRLLYGERTARTVQIIALLRDRDKAVTNALIAKAVEQCEKKDIPYLVYAHWPRGSLAEFKKNNGFEKVEVPRYFVPLTIKGRIALQLKLHRGVKRFIPENAVQRLIDLRTKWYGKKQTPIDNARSAQDK